MGVDVSLVMSAQERMEFLAGVHIGILSIERDGRAPLAVPVWYDYAPGGEILIWIGRDSVKDKLIKAAGRFSFVVQDETWPYKYVTAEGPVVAADEPPTRDQALQIVLRYAPEDEAVAYVDKVLSERSILVRMRPEKWLSSDQSKTG